MVSDWYLGLRCLLNLWGDVYCEYTNELVLYVMRKSLSFYGKDHRELLLEKSQHLQQKPTTLTRPRRARDALTSI